MKLFPKVSFIPGLMLQVSQRMKRLTKFFLIRVRIQIHTWWNEPNRCVTGYEDFETKKVHTCKFSQYLSISFIVSAWARVAECSGRRFRWAGSGGETETGKEEDAVMSFSSGETEIETQTDEWHEGGREPERSLTSSPKKRAITIRGFQLTQLWNESTKLYRLHAI